MSEYWISKKKYFCTYCEIYIADDAPSRAHHENGMRHQGNKERFVKGLYKAGERKKKDEEEERREMKNVEAAAQRAYALDVGAGRAGIGGSGPSKPAPKAAPPPPPKKPSNPYANYTTAEFLGYKDPDAERIQAELERKRSQGVAGQWELVSTTPSVASSSSVDPVMGATREVKPLSDGDITVVVGTKREADPPPVDDEDSRAWKLRKKTARLGDIYDPGVIPIKLKAKKEPEEIGISGSNTATIVSPNGTEAKATNVPKWTKVEWKRPSDSDPTPNRPTADTIPTESTPVKIEHDSSSSHERPPGPSEPSPPPSAPKIEPASVKSEEALLSDLPSNEGAGGSFFKKRKGKPLTGSAGRGRRDQF
jgi:WW domain-binding protein 4